MWKSQMFRFGTSSLEILSYRLLSKDVGTLNASIDHMDTLLWAERGGKNTNNTILSGEDWEFMKGNCWEKVVGENPAVGSQTVYGF